MNIEHLLNDETKNLIKQTMLTKMNSSEPTHNIRIQIAELVGKLAGQWLDDENKNKYKWPELFQTLLIIIKNNNQINQIEMVHECLTAMFPTIAHLFLDYSKNDIYKAWDNAFDINDEKVKLSAVKSFTTFVSEISKSELNFLNPLLRK
jgi:hypothetical protein